MRWFYLLAGLLCLAMVFIHAVTGGIETLTPVMAGEAPFEVRVGVLASWHALSVLFLLAALALFWAFGHADHATPLGVFLGLFLSVYGGLLLVLSWLWFENPMAMPWWTLVGAAGLFSLLAAH